MRELRGIGDRPGPAAIPERDAVGSPSPDGPPATSRRSTRRGRASDGPSDCVRRSLSVSGRQGVATPDGGSRSGRGRRRRRHGSETTDRIRHETVAGSCHAGVVLSCSRGRSDTCLDSALGIRLTSTRTRALTRSLRPISELGQRRLSAAPTEGLDCGETRSRHETPVPELWHQILRPEPRTDQLPEVRRGVSGASAGAGSDAAQRRVGAG